MLLLTIEKLYIGSPMVPWHLTLSDHERSNSGSLKFRSLLSRKGAELGRVLLLNVKVKTTYRKLNVSLFCSNTSVQLIRIMSMTLYKSTRQVF